MSATSASGCPQAKAGEGGEGSGLNVVIGEVAEVFEQQEPRSRVEVMTHRFSFRCLAPLGLLIACCVEPLEDVVEADGIPAQVRDRLAANCGIPGCHAGSYAPDLTASGSSVILDASSGGKPYVVLGDVQGSYLADAILGINGAMLMPPRSVPRTPEMEAEIATIFGWIAGAPFSVQGSSADSDSDAAFAPIQAIFTAKCIACHPALSPPNLTEGLSYDSIVEAVSVSGTATYITPGEPEESLLWGRISGSIGTIMPPAGSLTDDELTTIEDWILAGALE